MIGFDLTKLRASNHLSAGDAEIFPLLLETDRDAVRIRDKIAAQPEDVRRTGPSRLRSIILRHCRTGDENHPRSDSRRDKFALPRKQTGPLAYEPVNDRVTRARASIARIRSESGKVQNTARSLMSDSPDQQ